jgi:hypothetical protein
MVSTAGEIYKIRVSAEMRHTISRMFFETRLKTAWAALSSLVRTAGD